MSDDVGKLPGFFSLTLLQYLFFILQQARGLSGHTSPSGECICFNLEDSARPEVEEDYLPFSWSDSKWAHLVHCGEIFYSKLELLTTLWQAVLVSRCSAMVHAAWQLLTTAQQLIMVVRP